MSLGIISIIICDICWLYIKKYVSLQIPLIYFLLAGGAGKFKCDSGCSIAGPFDKKVLVMGKAYCGMILDAIFALFA